MLGGGVVISEEINININFSWNKYLIPSLLATRLTPTLPTEN